MPNKDWSRDELVVAFNLYCKIPFGRIHIRNPLVIELARALGRTPSAVSWKLANFARLDPSLRKRNITGASHGARAEVEVWNEFSENWERLAFESERLLAQITGHSNETEIEGQLFPEGVTRETMVRTRVGQGFFRSAVLAAYGSTCCITGCSIPELLNASHIIPWAVDVRNRTNPRNGLCLNALHDRAFDCGLITVTPELIVRTSARLRKKALDAASRDMLLNYDGHTVSAPRHFAPDPAFLRHHSERVFVN